MPSVPLAHRVRPNTIDECIGFETLRAGVLAPVLDGSTPPNLIFWGPPGSGKTTLASIVAADLGLEMAHRSAVEVGVKEVRSVIEHSRQRLDSPLLGGAATVLFLDEIHHFSRSQQDVVLKAVEEGSLYLIGATTENPSFKLNNAVLSRCLVIHIDAAEDAHIEKALQRAWTREQRQETLESEAIDLIVDNARGDYRNALGTLERAASAMDAQGSRQLTAAHAAQVIADPVLIYDRDQDKHYDAISALIKSMRGSDPDAALVYFAYMYEAGEDPLYIARRLVIFASEDVGNADPQAMTVALNAYQAYERLGRDQGWIPLSQAVVYLATAPKSNASYLAYKEAATRVRTRGGLEVPWHLRSKPTDLLRKLAKEQGGQAYEYPHDWPMGYATGQNYMPKGYEGEPMYRPVQRGHEKLLRQRMEYLKQMDDQAPDE